MTETHDLRNQWYDEPVQYETPMTPIEELKAQIKALQRKLEKLERTKSPVEEAYKDWWGEYPETGIFASNTDDARWLGFAAGYEFAYAISTAKEVMEKVQKEQEEENEWKLVALKLGEKLSDNGPGGYYDFTPGEWFEWALNEFEREMIKRNLKTSLKEMVNGDVRPIDDVVKEAKEEQKWDAVRESVKWCEDHPNENPLDYLTPKTPKETEQSLKEAFREAQQTEKWKEIQKLIDEEDNDKNFKNSLDLIKEWGEKNKPPTLYQILWEWWEDLEDTLNMENSIQDLVNDIEEWLPKEQSAQGSQNVYVECTVEGFNDCLNKIKGKLR